MTEKLPEKSLGISSYRSLLIAFCGMRGFCPAFSFWTKGGKKIRIQRYCMIGKKLPKSIRKFIRLEKARIRRQFFNSKEKANMIGELYQKFNRQHKETNPPVPVIEIPKEKVKVKTRA